MYDGFIINMRETMGKDMSYLIEDLIDQFINLVNNDKWFNCIVSDFDVINEYIKTVIMPYIETTDKVRYIVLIEKIENYTKVFREITEKINDFKQYCKKHSKLSMFHKYRSGKLTDFFGEDYVTDEGNETWGEYNDDALMMYPKFKTFCERYY